MEFRNPLLTASEVAEDYRRQRQAAVAKKSDFASLGRTGFREWMELHHEQLIEFARNNGASESEAPVLVEEYKRLLEELPPPSDFDDLSAQLILSRILSDIERVCRQSKLPIRNGAVFGLSPELGLRASQMPVLHTDASIIEVTSPFITFCNQISKITALSLCYSPEKPGQWRICNDPTEVAAKLGAEPQLAKDWSRILTAYGAFGWPTTDVALVMPNSAALIARVRLLRAMELFAVGHEYGHHLLRHGISDSSVESSDSFQDEHDADSFARMISIVVDTDEDPENVYRLSGVGGVAMLGSLDLVARTKSVLRTGLDAVPARKRHPPVAERIQHIAEWDNLLPVETHAAMQDLRDCFMEINEHIWKAVKPHIERLHEEGLRPQEDALDPSGWLPV